MHIRTIVAGLAALSSPVIIIAQDLAASEALLNNGLPACSSSCLGPAFEASGCGRTDFYCICNNVDFNRKAGTCERIQCSDADLQALTSQVSIICAPVGGVASTRFPTRYPNIPACANNCTSTALTASGCDPQDVKCACTNPAYLNVYGPCVEAVCNATDRARFTNVSIATCAAVGGSGPYNASQIGGYLNYTIPNGTAPAVPLLNASASVSVSSSTSEPLPTYTGGAAGMGEVSWGVVLGGAVLGGAVAMGVGAGIW